VAYTFHFPIDRTCGRLYYGRVAGPRCDWRAVADARGTIKVQSDSIGQKQELILKVNRQGATDLSFLAQLDSDALEALDLSDLAVHDEQMRDLADMLSLRSLRLDRARVTDQGLAWLPALRGLRNLSLIKTSVSDAGLAHISALKQLERLDLALTILDGSGLAYLRPLPALAFLSLFGVSTLKTAGWSELGCLRGLRSLDLSGTINDGDDRLVVCQANFEQ